MTLSRTITTTVFKFEPRKFSAMGGKVRIAIEGFSSQVGHADQREYNRVNREGRSTSYDLKTDSPSFVQVRTLISQSSDFA